MFDDNLELSVNLLLETAEEDEEQKKYYESEIWEPKHESFFDIDYLTEIQDENAILRIDEKKARVDVKPKPAWKKLAGPLRIVFWTWRVLFRWKDFVGINEDFGPEIEFVEAKKVKSLSAALPKQVLTGLKPSVEKVETPKVVQEEKTTLQEFLYKTGIQSRWLKYRKMILASHYIISINIENGYTSYIVFYGKKMSRIEKYGLTKWPGDKKAEEKPQKEHIKQSMMNILNDSYLESSDVFITLGTVQPRNWISKFPKVSKKELAQVVQFHIKKELGEESSNMVVEHSIVGTEIENDIEKLVVKFMAIAKENIDEIKGICAEIGISPIKISTSEQAMLNYLQQWESDYIDDGVMVLDVGSAASLVFLIEHGSVRLARNISIGEDNFTGALIKTFNVDGKAISVDKKFAGELRSQYGIPDVNNTMAVERGITLGQIGQAVQPVTERFLTEISRTIDHFRREFPNLDCNRLILSGPGSQMLHMVDILREELQFEVHLTTFPLDLYIGPNVTDETAVVKNHSWLVHAIGAAGASSEEFNLIANEGLSSKKESRGWLGVILAGLLSCLVLVVYTVDSVKELDKVNKRLLQVQSEINSLSSQEQEYLDLITTRDIRRNQNARFVGDMHEIQTHTSTAQMLRLVSNLIPPGIFLSRLEFITGRDSSAAADYIRIAGRAVPDNKTNSQELLVTFLLELEKSSYFTRVEVVGQDGNAKISDDDFELVCYLPKILLP